MDYRCEMGITRAEFLRLLPVAVNHETWHLAGDTIEGAGAAVQWRIHLEDKPARKIGNFALPVLGVTLSIEKPSGKAASRFLDRFLLAFQRAGG
jgi:hypothetical protein